MLLLGIDVGTTNLKVVLATPGGRVLAEHHEAYGVQRPREGWAEQNPHDWWQKTVCSTRQVLQKAGVGSGSVAAIGVSGQGCAVTLVDKAGAPVRPAILWMDTRSEPQCERLRDCCGDKILALSGKRPAPYNADPVLMWLGEHEPESLERAQCSLTSTGYITYRLTGRAVANVSDASILFAFDLAKDGWDDDLIEAFGLPRYLYPEVAACTEVVGGLTDEAARALGLNTGTPVIAGGEDTSSAGLAIGISKPGQAFLSLGTAGTLYAVQEKTTVHPQLLAFRHVLPQQLLLGGSMVAMGGALAWAGELFEKPIETLSQLAATSPAGAGGLLFLPYLSGELQPINDGNARALFFGLGFSTRQEDLVRAVFEGTAFAVRHNLELISQVGEPVEEIRAVGGPTRSALWCQIIADVTGYPLSVLADNAGAPLGNALLAARGIGLIDDVADAAQRAAVISQMFTPNNSNHDHYTQLYKIYASLYPQLKASFGALAALKEAR